VLLNIITFAYIRYRDPYVKVKDDPLPKNPPLFSLIIPVKNEEENIRACVESCLKQSYENKEVIIVNDGSTDMTRQILDGIWNEWGSNNLHIFHLSKSVGKKQAIEVASKFATGQIYAFMDSDCDMAHDAVEKAAKIFSGDKNLGALTAHVRVRNAHGGNLLEKMQDVYTDGSCRAVKGAETWFSSVVCCSGALSFYRRAAIQDFIHDWAHDKFLGFEFKFCTDRRLTSHVLATSPSLALTSYHIEHHQQDKERQNQNPPRTLPLLSVSRTDMKTEETMPGRHFEKKIPNYWNVKYSQSVRVNLGVPRTFSTLIKQQIRWKKSFLRSLFSTGTTYWRRPFWIALLYYIQTVMKFVRPYVLFYALFVLPFEGDLRSTGFWFLGILFTGMIYAVDFRLRNPGDPLWLYRPIFAFLTTFVYTWLLPYAAMTIKNRTWR
jgi:hyaluronan synthase